MTAPRDERAERELPYVPEAGLAVQARDACVSWLREAVHIPTGLSLPHPEAVSRLDTAIAATSLAANATSRARLERVVEGLRKVCTDADCPGSLGGTTEDCNCGALEWNAALDAVAAVLKNG